MSVARADIRFERRGHLGVVVLDRPAALNALTWPMVRQLSLQLVEWRHDPEIAAVLIKAAPGRAFCAGGDIRAVAELVRAYLHHCMPSCDLFFLLPNLRIAMLRKPAKSH